MMLMTTNRYRVLWSAMATVFFPTAPVLLAQEDTSPAGMGGRGDPRQIPEKAQVDAVQTTADVLREAGLELATEKPEPASEQAHQLLLALGDDGVTEVTRLIKLGVPIEVRLTSEGLTPMMIAQSPEMVRTLLQLGADPNRTDDAGATALHHLLFSSGAGESVALLIEAGADVDVAAAGVNLETPLLAARQPFFEGGDPELGEHIIRMLHRAGASVDAQDGKGYTLLMTAAVNDKPNLARLMLWLGAEPHVRLGDGATALTLARELGNREIEQILLEGGARQ